MDYFYYLIAIVPFYAIIAAIIRIMYDKYVRSQRNEDVDKIADPIVHVLIIFWPLTIVLLLIITPIAYIYIKRR